MESLDSWHDAQAVTWRESTAAGVARAALAADEDDPEELGSALQAVQSGAKRAQVPFILFSIHLYTECIYDYICIYLCI